VLRVLKKLAVQRVRPLFGSFVYVARRGLVKGMRRKGGFSFVPGGKLTAEEKFLLDLKLQGLTVYDIGGWEGVYTMFFARAVGPTGRVLTFEPNPANRERIEENVALNNLTNVLLRPVALGSAPGPATLVIEGGLAGEGGVRSIAPADAQGQKGSGSLVQVDVETLDREIELHTLPLPDLVKIDVEGFELNVLEGMARTIDEHHCRILLEIHRLAARPDQAGEVMEFLLRRGYGLHHIESGRRIHNSSFELAHSDHLYCE
jgi:FkbM family methyltransferase